MKITIEVKRKEEVELSNDAVASAIMQYVDATLGGVDDAGCDWGTDNNFNTYIGDESWRISTSRNIATLVDAANIIHFGQRIVLDPMSGNLRMASEVTARAHA